MPPALLRLERRRKSGRESKPKSLREKEEETVLSIGRNTAHNAVHNTVLKCRSNAVVFLGSKPASLTPEKAGQAG
jgi:hypothetical protein